MALTVCPANGGATPTAAATPARGDGQTAGIAPAGWLDRAQRDLENREYAITWQTAPAVEGLAPAWHAPNRAQGFRTYFTEGGIRTVPRTGEGPEWRWGLELIGYGRAGQTWRVPPASLAPSGKRIDYYRGALTEWYENDARGLKQGFILPAPPKDAARQWGAGLAAGAGRPSARGRDVDPLDLVHLDLALWGDLSPVIAADGQAIDFVIPGGEAVVRYAELGVTDGRGEALPAWMEGFAGDGVRGIRLVVDARQAVYPITVDPLTTSPVWTAESNQPQASFGISVATAGDVNGDGYSDLIIGAESFDNGEPDEGRAFLYLGSAAGPEPIAAWTAEGDQAGALFGRSVATAGDVNGDGYADVIVGAWGYDNPTEDEGQAFVYLGSANGLAPAAVWTAEGDQFFAYFGYSVSTAGDVNGDGFADVIVGAYQYNNGQLISGAAFGYYGSPAGPSPTPDWTAVSDQESGFGVSVGTAGDVNGDGFSDIIVGALWYSNMESLEGAAFAYFGSSSGLSPIPDWTEEGDQPDINLGYSVATAGDVNGDGYADVIIGTPFYDQGQTDEGGAFVYLGSAAGLASSPVWSAESDQAGSDYGSSVATAGDVNGDGYADVIVGASFYDNGETNEGRAFVYLGSAAGPSTIPDWTVESNQAGALFGRSVATSGDVNGDGFSDIIVGAIFYDNGEFGEGGAFVYQGSPAGPSLNAAWTADRDQTEAQFSWSVSTAGDVNGDGFADVIVGAPFYDSGVTDEGAAFFYLGSETGLSLSHAWSAEGGQSGAWFGYSVSTAGDVNGDGYADVVVGAPRYDNGEADEGRAILYLGSAVGLSPGPAWTAESDQGSAELGISVATAGDVNGDGYADVIVGAWVYENGQSNEGRALVYLGSSAGLSPGPAWTAEGNQTQALFGSSVATAGDVNGDGYADVIVGAYLYDNGELNEGRALVYLGSATGLSTSSAWTAESNQLSAEFGYSVASAGDVNGDGYADVIVGAPLFDNGQGNEGRAFLYLGSSAGLSFSPAWTAESDQAGAQFGYSVATAGDVNGDGYADVIVGAFLYDNGQSNEGRASAYLGSAAGLSPISAWTAESDQDSAELGQSVATAGDVNGDGYADIIVGSFLFDNGESNEGAAFLYYGNASAGTVVRPQQRRTDDLAPIAPGGRSRTSGSFRLASLGRSPFGRGGVGLEWEIKPLGTSFNGAGTQKSTSFIDSGTAGDDLNELVSGLNPGRYHWRARLLYDPITTPFQSASRWFTVPWNGWEEGDLTLSGFLGGFVWEDRNGDGIRNGGELDLGGVVVSLLDSGNSSIAQTVTSGDGSYRFELPTPGSFRLEFNAPAGYILTTRDQGFDDTLDSDADPISGQTALAGPLFTAIDELRWSAGLRLVGPCVSPDEPIYIAGVRMIQGTSDMVIDFLDPNQPGAVTGYNVYRSTDPALDPTLWPRLADDVVDADLATPNNQWVDESGDVPPMGGAFYYDLAAYNHFCDAEGPR